MWLETKLKCLPSRRLRYQKVVTRSSSWMKQTGGRINVFNGKCYDLLCGINEVPAIPGIGNWSHVLNALTIVFMTALKALMS